MRIGIDARWITQESSGIGHYTLNLIRYLSESVGSTHEYFIFYSHETAKQHIHEVILPQEKSHFIFVYLPYSVFSLKSQFLLPFKLCQFRIEVFHSTNFMIPFMIPSWLCKTKLIITIHDLIPFLFPHFAPQSKKSRFYWIYRVLMMWIVKKVDFIWVDSQHSRQDMIRHFPWAKEKIDVLTFGADPSFKKLSACEVRDDIKKRFKISGPIILYVGRRDPYKNILGLIKIFKQLLNKKPDVYLVLAGPEDPRYPEIQQLISKLELDGKVTMTGYLSQEELVGLYNLSSVVVMPSFYEGFGLPVLEAFHCGIPVVASRVASVPELVGDAGILLDPKTPEIWPSAIFRVLTDETLRAELIRKGFERLQQFSWGQAVKRLIKKYEEMAQ